MKPSNELFYLIKSLTKSEKRFFKLSSSIQTGEKNYSRLFDYIDSQDAYDEAKLKIHFKDERFIKHLPSEKNHLYKLILKSLRQFHSDHSITTILQEELKNIEILYNKTLYKEAKKFLLRAKKNAHEVEAFYLLTDILTWEKILTEESYESGDFDVDLNKIIEEESEVIEKLRNLAEYHILYSKINALFRSDGFTKNEQQRQKVNEIANYHLIKGKNTALSVRAASICYYIQGLCAATNRDFETSYKKFKRVCLILDKYPRIRGDLSQRYILALSHLSHCYMYNGAFSKAKQIIEDISLLKGKEGFKSVQLNVLITNVFMTEQIKINNLQGKFKDSLKVINQQFEKNKELIERSSKENKIKIYFNIAYTFFAIGEFKEALHFVNIILNDNEQRLRQDLYSFTRLLNILIHFELENNEYVDSLAGSSLRYLNKLQNEHQIESVFIKQLRKIAKTNDAKKERVKFQKVLDEINELLVEENERVILEYIDIVSWLESKINNQSFSEMVQKNSSIRSKSK